MPLIGTQFKGSLFNIFYKIRDTAYKKNIKAHLCPANWLGVILSVCIDFFSAIIFHSLVVWMYSVTEQVNLCHVFLHLLWKYGDVSPDGCNSWSEFLKVAEFVTEKTKRNSLFVPMVPSFTFQGK